VYEYLDSRVVQRAFSMVQKIPETRGKFTCVDVMINNSEFTFMNHRCVIQQIVQQLNKEGLPRRRAFSTSGDHLDSPLNLTSLCNSTITSRAICVEARQLHPHGAPYS